MELVGSAGQGLSHSVNEFFVLSSLNLLVHLQTTFTNSLDPDQDRQNVRPDLDPICLRL